MGLDWFFLKKSNFLKYVIETLAKFSPTLCEVNHTFHTSDGVQVCIVGKQFLNYFL
jgi:hypothetical protein